MLVYQPPNRYNCIAYLNVGDLTNLEHYPDPEFMFSKQGVLKLPSRGSRFCFDSSQIRLVSSVSAKNSHKLRVFKNCFIPWAASRAAGTDLYLDKEGSNQPLALSREDYNCLRCQPFTQTTKSKYGQKISELRWTYKLTGKVTVFKPMF